MPTSRLGRVRARTFDGLANITGSAMPSLFALLATILKMLARIRVRYLGLPPLVDNSGGTAGASVAAVTVPDVTDTSSSGGATVASVNTAADTVMAAYAVLITRMNQARAVLGMGSAPVGPGTVASAGTVAVIDDSVASASGDTSASQASVALVFADLLDAQRVVVAGVDELRAAVGLGAVPWAATPQGDKDDALTMPSPIADASAVSAGNAETEGVALADIDAQLDILSDNIALLVGLIDEALQARRNRVIVGFEIPATEYAAGTSCWAISPCHGRIRRARTVATAATTGVGTVTVELATVAVSGLSVTIADSSAAGTIDDSGEVADHATQIVAEGQAIEIVSDGTPSGGAVRGHLEIEPLEISGSLEAYVG